MSAIWLCCCLYGSLLSLFSSIRLWLIIGFIFIFYFFVIVTYVFPFIITIIFHYLLGIWHVRLLEVLIHGRIDELILQPSRVVRAALSALATDDVEGDLGFREAVVACDGHELVPVLFRHWHRCDLGIEVSRHLHDDFPREDRLLA